MLVVLGAAKSSPGTTTAVLAIAGCLRDRVVIEGDPDGGVIATRFGLAREPNLASLATSARAHLPDVAEHTQILPGGVPVVVGLNSADRAVGLWRTAGLALSSVLAGAGDTLCLLDAGRLSPTSPVLPALKPAALTVVVARPTADELLPLSQRLPAIQEVTDRCALLLVGDKPYRPAEVAQQLGVEILGVIAHDPRAAAALAGTAGNARALRRSALARSARDVAAALLARLDLPAAAAPVHEAVSP